MECFPGSQVRNGLAAGGRWIRTVGPPYEGNDKRAECHIFKRRTGARGVSAAAAPPVSALIRAARNGREIDFCDLRAASDAHGVPFGSDDFERAAALRGTPYYPLLGTVRSRGRAYR
jgi:hypothetical protein